MNYFVYALEHVYTDETHTDYKFLGYFDDIEKLLNAKENALALPGFRTYPDGLTIRKYELNKIHWQNGFDCVVGEIGRDYLKKEDVLTENSRSIKELNLQYVFQISHIYTIHTFLEDERTIGVFLDEDVAYKIIDDLKIKQGFSDYPEDFILSEFTLNEQLWTSGF
ncbi:hypothetical protein J2787_001068 [Chryseobacterium rhizosphaerae]|uniref:Uncharacterized protein n=1 Tax=Chryseobacterium rhizosphaerae TaxID=395937 RepID=A0AAE3Y8U1_9FLAO|nr:hypothetical protein [Chryseobacterium rhizosphaerae]MDR6525698.1 hypothetical protein [Chryseobacterium rhizosphaerae]